MKKYLFILMAGLLSFSATDSFAQSFSKSDAPRLYVSTTQSNADYMEIQYEITHAGFVELHLFSPEGEKLWIKGKPTNRVGSDVIRIRKKPLEPGKRYTFILKYKGKDYNGSFIAS